MLQPWFVYSGASLALSSSVSDLACVHYFKMLYTSSTASARRTGFKRRHHIRPRRDEFQRLSPTILCLCYGRVCTLSVPPILLPHRHTHAALHTTLNAISFWLDTTIAYLNKMLSEINPRLQVQPAGKISYSFFQNKLTGMIVFTLRIVMWQRDVMLKPTN